SSGTLVLNADGSFSYEPDPDSPPTEPVTFTYLASAPGLAGALFGTVLLAPADDLPTIQVKSVRFTNGHEIRRDNGGYFPVQWELGGTVLRNTIAVVRNEALEVTAVFDVDHLGLLGAFDALHAFAQAGSDATLFPGIDLTVDVDHSRLVLRG